MKLKHNGGGYRPKQPQHGSRHGEGGSGHLTAGNADLCLVCRKRSARGLFGSGDETRWWLVSFPDPNNPSEDRLQYLAGKEGLVI